MLLKCLQNQYTQKIADTAARRSEWKQQQFLIRFTKGYQIQKK